MFEALNAASAKNKYDLSWVELAPVQFQGVIPKWLDQLSKNPAMSGPSAAQRAALADEFYRLLHIYKQVLEAQSPAGPPSMETARADVNVKWFAEAYKKKFGTALKAPPSTEAGLKDLLSRQKMLSDKLELLDSKLQLINYWMLGAEKFPEHREGRSLLFQYMGNAPTEKVRLFLEVLCSDADKAVKIKDPGIFKASFETQKGLKTAGGDGKLYKIEWTDTAFKRAIKAEAGASYGVSATGACELEFKGIKAKLEAEAWAGARAKAEGQASWSVGGGGSVKGSVEAEIGIKLKVNASVDCADIFACEVSAEAFAGAMAKAELEVTAAVGNVTVKLGAEAFAGARLKGEAKMTLKLQGYPLVEANATGALTAGAGAKFALEFQSSVFSGTSFKFEAGATAGVGAEAGMKLTTHGDNFKPAMYSLYYTAHLNLLGRKQEAYTWKTYFRGIEDNVALFKKAKAIIIDEHMKTVILERNRLFTDFSAWKQLEGLAAFRATGTV